MYQAPRTPDAKAQASIEKRWREAAPLSATDPPFLYLWNRGLLLSLRRMPTTLRYHARLPYRHEDGALTYHPAMLARVDNPAGNLATIHRTYLTTDGRKAAVPHQKKLMPCAQDGASAGGAIRLYPAGETLCVTEGIETALAVRLQSGYPVWSTVSATGLVQVVVPTIVQAVLICADHDQAGIEAAHALAYRLMREGRQIKILLPPTPGTDWADEVKSA
jgi:putative DNA primase/helicase